jgi:hypothetical protein
MSDHILAVASVVLSLASIVVALLKRRGLSLTEVAVRAVGHAEQMGGTNAEKLAHAIHAAQRLDAGDNDKRDFSDAQLRIAIEAEINRKK